MLSCIVTPPPLAHQSHYCHACVHWCLVMSDHTLPARLNLHYRERKYYIMIVSGVFKGVRAYAMSRWGGD